MLNFSISPNKNSIQKTQINKNNKFTTGISRKISNNKFTTGFPQKILNNKFRIRKSISQKGFLNGNLNGYTNITNNINYANNTIVNFQKRRNIRKNSTILPLFKTKRRKNILSQIIINIKKTNQNLNNPDAFYSNYFNSILLGELNEKNLLL